MKEARTIILNLKNQESLTKEQFWEKMKQALASEVDNELEKLMREGEIFFPKNNMITRII